MVEFKVKANPTGQYYFPKEVREELGHNLKMVCNAKAAIVYNAETSIQTVLESIDIIIRDLRHRLELQQKEAIKQ
jgi:bifunctional DNA-binding transcriptional regulator/antitoxin component of YhaV-PrlF toxin-antitoxin module